MTGLFLFPTEGAFLFLQRVQQLVHCLAALGKRGDQRIVFLFLRLLDRARLRQRFLPARAALFRAQLRLRRLGGLLLCRQQARLLGLFLLQRFLALRQRRLALRQLRFRLRDQLGARGVQLRQALDRLIRQRNALVDARVRLAGLFGNGLLNFLLLCGSLSGTFHSARHIALSFIVFLYSIIHR